MVGPLSGHKVDGGTTAKPGSVTIIDTDGDPLVMHEDGRHRLVIREGTKGRYGLKLDTRPTHTVHLRGIQSDGDEDLHVLSNHTVLPIAPDEWKTPIWMVIQAEQDDDAVNGERVFLNSVHSRDPAYNSLTLPDVLVVEDDDDAHGVDVGGGRCPRAGHRSRAPLLRGGRRRRRKPSRGGRGVMGGWRHERRPACRPGQSGERERKL